MENNRLHLAAILGLANKTGKFLASSEVAYICVNAKKAPFEEFIKGSKSLAGKQKKIFKPFEVGCL